MQAAKQRRLVLYVGAGLSNAQPSCGPTGWAVAELLRQAAATILGREVEELAGLDLEALGKLVADSAPDRLEELRDRAAEAFDFRDPPGSKRAACLSSRPRR